MTITPQMPPSKHHRQKPAESLTESASSSFEHLSASARNAFERDVLMGLSAAPKTLPCKYFYDARGSSLFEQICETPEYYVTRTEVALLRQACPVVAELVGAGVDVLEPGSGAGEKVRILLDALQKPRSFIPIDISKSAMAASAAALSRDYPKVDVHPLVADFTRPLQIPGHFLERPPSGLSDRAKTDGPKAHKKLIFFPGSTISNFDPEDALLFLKDLRGALSPGDVLFIGVDRIKSRNILESAYNDSQGITAEFNLNLLWRIRRELDTDLDPRTFKHHAFYNADKSRIEMHLVSLKEQVVSIGTETFTLERGESIHTENSYKYSVQGFSDLARRAGFQIERTFSDTSDLFSLYLCRVVG